MEGINIEKLQNEITDVTKDRQNKLLIALFSLL